MQGQQAQQAVGELQQQLQQEQQKNADKTMDAQLKARELSIKEFEAETERIKTIKEAEAREQDRQARIIESANRPAEPREPAPAGF
jgi:hypothetical protein